MNGAQGVGAARRPVAVCALGCWALTVLVPVSAAGGVPVDGAATDWGDDSARDDAIFGGEGSARDDAIFGGEGSGDAGDRLLAGVAAANDRLALGGQAYLRAETRATDEVSAARFPLSTPMLYDVYLDGRAHDRLRIYVRGRLRHTPSVVGPARTTALLDQFWLKFDIAEELYVTLGRQPIRWGSGRFWNPTDVVNIEERDPLAIFDERTGVEMVKLHWPLESLGWNFYAIGTYGGASAPRDVGLALRAEMLFSTVEVAFSAARMPAAVLGLTLPVAGGAASAGPGAWERVGWVRQEPWLLGADVSAGVGLVDLRAELGLQHGVGKLFLRPGKGALPSPFSRRDAWLLQGTLGAEISVRYSDQDHVILGCEYFYNQRGIANPMPYLMFLGLATPLQMGRHYGAAYGVLMAPGSWNDSSVIASVLRSFSDGSALVRMDYQVRVLTYLDLNLYATYHFGNEGELRLRGGLPPEMETLIESMPEQAVALPDHLLAKLQAPGSRGVQVVDVGVALRLSL